MSVQHHVIRREVLKAAVEGTEADGLALHRRLAALCNDWLAPALEEALSRIAPADEHWIVQRLEVDAEFFTPDLLERDFVNAVAAAVERQIRERTAAGGTARQGAGAREDEAPAAREALGAIRRLSGPQSIEEALAYFLATGALPWWFGLPAGETLKSVATAALFADGPSAYLPARLDRGHRRAGSAHAPRSPILRAVPGDASGAPFAARGDDRARHRDGDRAPCAPSGAAPRAFRAALERRPRTRGRAARDNDGAPNRGMGARLLA